jgi:broad specificity phosphatase PhoE
MGNLLLIRHGQASFFEENYDRLSPLGELQSRKLAEYWMRYEVQVDRVYTGPLERQRRTAEVVAETYASAGKPWPEITVLSELSEYEAERYLKEYIPKLIETHPPIRELHDNLLAAEEIHSKGRVYQKLFEAAVLAWIRGEVETDGIEKLDAFDNRVNAGLDEIVTEAEGGARVAAFTSGGPCGMAVKRALGCGLEAAIELTWMVKNASMTEFLFTCDRFTLSAFNAIPHLEDPAHWTYR